MDSIRTTHEYNFADVHQVKTVIQMFLLGAGLDCYREVAESKGYPDMVIVLDNRMIVVEFKYTVESAKTLMLLEQGVEQIKERSYGASYDCSLPRVRLAVVYDAVQKKLAGYTEC